MTEEYEHVPWSELATDPGPDRRRLAYLTAGLLVAAALGIVGVRALWPAAPAPATGTAAPGTSEPVAASAPPPAEPLAAAAPELFSEADLRAAGDPDGAITAVMKAEWFVTDYFTTDRDPRGSIDLRTALPGDAGLPDLPQDGPAGPVAYVEWARAFRSEDLGSGLHRVAVAFRTIAGADGEPLARLPVRAVEVVVRVAEGGVAVVDLPAPAQLPLDVGYPAWPDEPGELPAELAAQVLRDAEAWGDNAEIVAATPAAGGWRVTVNVTDEAGAAWPLALWYDDGGALTAPPWAAD